MRGPHPVEQVAPRDFCEAVMAKDDAGAVGQPRDRVQQAVALPLVGHQPEARQRLAGGHGPSYSSRHGAFTRWSEVRARIAKAAALAGREPGEVTLIAVSKTQPAEAIEALIARRPARVRRESGAGGRGEVAGAARRAIRSFGCT